MKMISILAAFALILNARAALPPTPPGTVPPGDPFELPAWTTAAGAPQIFEHSQEAGPDETLFLVGTNLTRDIAVWGAHPDNPGGKAVAARVQFATNSYLAVTLPEKAFDGPMVLAVKNAAGTSEPIVINTPQPWWCHPSAPAPGSEVRLFGRNLACRPDGRKAWIWLTAPDGTGQWLDAEHVAKYDLSFRLPERLKPGRYALWLHGGRGGDWGWGKPLTIDVTAPAKPRKAVKRLKPGDNIQSALDAVGARGGGTVRLAAGHYPYTGTLRIPAAVTLSGAGRDATTLELQTSPPASFARFESVGWNITPGAIHNRGDSMTYALDVPRAGRWTVWLRYATDMSPWKQPGVSSNSTLRVDDAAPVMLENLPNTGSFNLYRWTRSAVLDLPKGKHTLVWTNTGGGGMSLDAFALLSDPNAEPSDKPLPVNHEGCIVIQAENCTRFLCKAGTLPNTNRAAVWLSGDGAALESLTVLGNAQVNQGLALRAVSSSAWVSGCRVQEVRVADCEGKQAENCGLYARQVRGATIGNNELWGRTPLFLSGVRESAFTGNRLVSVTRYGGNAEAAILGRTEPIEHCLIEGNVIASPPGAEAGGPTARRLLWFSTGHGSVAYNWIADNGVENPACARQARFGGVAGTDQNVGEMILFEGNHRTMYFGPLAGADAQSVTLPAAFPPTPDDRLGNVKREQLPLNAQGLETPFWPPDAADGTDEPTIGEYYVSIFAGPGQGQTRHVTGRTGERLMLDAPWRVPPQAGSVVAVGTMFYRNLIVGNHTPDGMTGVQLWISCVENVVAANTVARQRKPGLFLYANGTTLASSMPRTWNRGISPLFWNLAEGNRTEECSDGALVTSGDAANLPVDFPRALGNVLRHNSFIRSRQNGVILTSRKREDNRDASASVVGTVVEFNVVRDAPTAYHAAQGNDFTVFRRDHAYAWYPVNASFEPVTAFQLDVPEATVAIEQNSVEGKTGVKDGSILDVKKSWEKEPRMR